MVSFLRIQRLAYAAVWADWLVNAHWIDTPVQAVHSADVQRRAIAFRLVLVAAMSLTGSGRREQNPICSLNRELLLQRFYFRLSVYS